MKRVEYSCKSKQDFEQLDLAFNKTQADLRKKWILEAVKNLETLNCNSNDVSISDLINKELVLFSIEDNVRSIPNLIDGLKPSQRKVLFACFKRNLTKEIKVSQLAGYISEHTSYHHGEQSLMDTVINLAQNYTGSNNINLLFPSGQFGSRLMGGKDSSSPRYIFTKLTKEAEKLFNKDDFTLLEYLNDDGFSIEPKFYVPTLPLLLINGSIGIGTGFSTNIPCFNPADITDRLYKLNTIEDYEIEELTPWYQGFTGKIEKIDENKWITRGLYLIDNYTITVTELPIGTWTEDYKQYLEKLQNDSIIHSFENNSSETIVCFEIKIKKDILQDWKKSKSVEKNLKLTSNINAQNMHVFNEKGQIVKMSSAEEILFIFWCVRCDYHKKRKKYLKDKLQKEMKILEAKTTFIDEIIEEKIVIYKKSKKDIIKILKERNYPNDSYDYLLDMQIHSFTYEKVQQLNELYHKKQLEYSKIKNMTINDMWDSDFQ